MLKCKLMIFSASRYQVFPRSHLQSFFITTDSEINIIMNTEENVFFKTKFFSCCKNDREEIEGRTMVHREGTKVVFTLCFTKVGLYLFNITAKKGDEITEDVVFNYVIQVMDTQGVRSSVFPKYSSIWGSACENYGEDRGIVGTGEEVQLWVKIPGATKIVAIQDHKWEELAKVRLFFDGVIKESIPSKVLKFPRALVFLFGDSFLFQEFPP